MHLECRLPSGAGGMAAAHTNGTLRKRIREWASVNGNPEYKDGPVPSYRFCLEFTDEHYYTIFLLTFDQTKMFSKFELIDED